MPESKKYRPIRSFVRREGRITPAQRRALEDYWPQYGIEAGDDIIEFERVFGRPAPLVLEIGFGNGEALVEAAESHPQNNYLGIEVHRPGVGSLLRRLAERKITNVRIMQVDAKEVLAKQIADRSLSAVHLFFPDPWPKSRHHKRRLVQPDFSALVARKLVLGGYIHLATDWQDYAEHIVAILSKTPGMVDVSPSYQFQGHAAPRGQTRFERRGRQLGHEVRDLIFQSRL